MIWCSNPVNRQLVCGVHSTNKRNIFNVNASSIVQKRSHLILHAIGENTVFITLPETWLKTRDKHQLMEVIIKNYNGFAKCRLNKMVGSEMIYTKSNLDVIQLTTMEREAHYSLYVRATIKNENYILKVNYWPPKWNYEKEENLYAETENVIKNKSAVFCGDFRDPLLTGLLSLVIQEALNTCFSIS